MAEMLQHYKFRVTLYIFVIFILGATLILETFAFKIAPHALNENSLKSIHYYYEAFILIQ